MKKVSRRELARAIARQLLDGVDQAHLIRQVAAYLVDHKMTSQLDMLLQDIAIELQAQTGNIAARAESAFPLNASLQAALRNQILQLTGASAVELDVTTNPDLIGGVVIRIPGNELDLSVRRKLTSLSSGGA